VLGRSYVNLERGLYEHNIGHSKFTSIAIPWNIVHSEEYSIYAEQEKRRPDQKNEIKKDY
jgi:putative endonuclease